ncbi:hypothetical protein DERP_015155 [Dermatophagoides pteronyssinus]|uniref:Uncharacterized protein n=1 Tax=Dermatophagoides pteronyssinus TaxID=6956 RepID=A0ABQ8JU64_DERPT|nr:hypothetical protein DERP_015155 [Dermatophagoides pteronyssinus]
MISKNEIFLKWLLSFRMFNLLLLLLLKIKCDNPFNDKYLYHHSVYTLSNYIPLESPFLNSSTIVFEQIIFGNDRKLLAIHMITIIITVAVRDIRGLNGCTMAKYLYIC